MRIVTNPGSDLPASLVEALRIDLTAQHVIVDGVEHDTRDAIPQEQIDQWVRTAKLHPYILGTSAAEFATAFSELGRDDPELLAVMTSRKIIQSHDAAVSASKTLAAHGRGGARQVRVQVVDTAQTSIAAGLATVIGAVARDAGLSLSDSRRIVEQFCTQLDMKLSVATLEYMVKGGRASALRAWFADLMGVRPILTLANGEVAVAGKISAKRDPVEALAEEACGRFMGRRLWVAVAHGRAPDQADRLAALLRERLEPEFLYIEPFSAGIYLNTGPGSIAYALGPVDRLDFDPQPPDH